MAAAVGAEAMQHTISHSAQHATYNITQRSMRHTISHSAQHATYSMTRGVGSSRLSDAHFGPTREPAAPGGSRLRVHAHVRARVVGLRLRLRLRLRVFDATADLLGGPREVCLRPDSPRRMVRSVRCIAAVGLRPSDIADALPSLERPRPPPHFLRSARLGRTAAHRQARRYFAEAGRYHLYYI